MKNYTLVNRRAWGAIEPKRIYRRKKDPKVLTIHYIGAPIAADDPEEPRVRQIQRFHQNTRGWTDTAYNWLSGLGRVYVGRGKKRKNAADGRLNNNGSLSICVLVGSKHPPKEEHYTTLQEFIWDVVDEFPTIKKIRPHRRLKATSCPGSHLTERIKSGFFSLYRPVIAVVSPSVKQSEKWNGELPSWTRLTTKNYAKDRATVGRVEAFRSMVQTALNRHSVGDQLDVALAVMACESSGKTDDTTGNDWGPYQFIESTWKRFASNPTSSRLDPAASFDTMARVVKRQGWRDWEGGVLDNGKRWGSGPKGFACWRFPEAEPVQPSDGPWYANELASAVALNITTGTRPDDYATRAEAAVMAMRAWRATQ